MYGMISHLVTQLKVRKDQPQYVIRCNESIKISSLKTPRLKPYCYTKKISVLSLPKRLFGFNLESHTFSPETSIHIC